jgi:Transposase, Mutator family
MDGRGAMCGAGYGERSEELTNTRNRYRRRELDTRLGAIEVAIPKLCMPYVKSCVGACAMAGGPCGVAGY